MESVVMEQQKVVEDSGAIYYGELLNGLYHGCGVLI
jgi:hypothetical protein